MGLFDSMSTALTGVNVYQTWMDAISDNVANVNDVTTTSQAAYQPRYVVAESIAGQVEGTGAGSAEEADIGGGVEVTGIALGDPAGVVEYDPDNPLADKHGMVRATDVDLGTQMTDMIMAQNGYEANLATINRAQDAYQAALGLKV